MPKAFVVLAGILILPASASAAMLTYTGRADDIHFTDTVIPANVTVGPDTGPISTTTSANTSLSAASASSTPIPGASIGATALSASVVAESGQSQGKAQLATLTLSTLLLPSISANIVGSTSTTTCKGFLASSGSSVGSVTVGATTLTISATPNQTFTVDGLKVVLNEQVPIPGGLLVNAVHITDTTLGVDLVIAHAESDVEGCPTPVAAYADQHKRPPGGSGLPSPWQGSPKVVFVGCNATPPGSDPCRSYGYDGGAIRFDNPTNGTPLTFSNARVAIGTNCTFSPWPGLNRTIQPGQSLILTETGGSKSNTCASNHMDDPNFDTSESQPNRSTPCTPDGLVPVISVTINGVATTISDPARLLNKGGVEVGNCTHTSEFHQWAPL